MPMIDCPECGEKVSDQSTSCIHCGMPFQSKQNTQTIEATSKKWKKLQLIGGLLIATSIPCGFIGASSSYSTVFFLLAVITFVAGITAYTKGKFGAWYHNR